MKITLSGDQSSLLRDLDGLRPPLGAQLIEQAARVRLHRVLANEEFLGDFSGAEPLRDRGEDLELARGDPELLLARAVDDERRGRRHANLDRYRDLPDDDGRLRPGELEPESNAKPREKQGDDAPVDLDRVLADKKPVFDELERDDEHAAEQAIDDNGLLHEPS